MEQASDNDEMDGRNLKKDIDSKEILAHPHKKFKQKVDDGEIQKPEHMVVLSLKVEEVTPEVDPEDDKKGKPPKKETRLYYRFY